MKAGIEHTVKHHVVAFLVSGALLMLFFLSSSSTTHVVAYGAGGQHSFTVEDRPLRGISLNSGWSSDGYKNGCASLAEETQIKRLGFPFYYQRHIKQLPCDDRFLEFNIVGFSLNVLLASAAGLVAGALVHHRHGKNP